MQQVGRGLQHVGRGLQHVGAGAQHFLTGLQQDGFGLQQDDFPPNRPESSPASAAEPIPIAITLANASNAERFIAVSNAVKSQEQVTGGLSTALRKPALRTRPTLNMVIDRDSAIKG